MTTLTNHLNETTEFLKEKGVQQADFGLILGSGLGELANEITDAIAIPFSEIPHFSVSTVVGHAGQLVYGTRSGKKVLAMQGRFHYYEGHSMSHAYTQEYREVAKKVAAEQNIDLKEGVYMGFSGPTYETPAEIRMSRTMGADAVGMSTVSEVIVAVHSGMKVLGISCITNLAAGMQSSLNHAEVVETTERVKGQFKELVKATLAAL